MKVFGWLLLAVLLVSASAIEISARFGTSALKKKHHKNRKNHKSKNEVPSLSASLVAPTVEDLPVPVSIDDDDGPTDMKDMMENIIEKQVSNQQSVTSESEEDSLAQLEDKTTMDTEYAQREEMLIQEQANTASGNQMEIAATERETEFAQRQADFLKQQEDIENGRSKAPEWKGDPLEKKVEEQQQKQLEDMVASQKLMTQSTPLNPVTMSVGALPTVLLNSTSEAHPTKHHHHSKHSKHHHH